MQIKPWHIDASTFWAQGAGSEGCTVGAQLIRTHLWGVSIYIYMYVKIMREELWYGNCFKAFYSKVSSLRPYRDYGPFKWSHMDLSEDLPPPKLVWDPKKHALKSR